MLRVATLAIRSGEGNARRLLAVGFDLRDVEEIVLTVPTAVDGVPDAGVQNQGQEGTGDGEQPDDLVLLAPALPGLVEDGEEEDAGEADETRPAVGLRKLVEDVVDLRCRAVPHVGLAQERAHLVEDDGDGHGGDKPTEDGERDELKQKAELEEAKHHAVDAHHHGNG